MDSLRTGCGPDGSSVPVPCRGSCNYDLLRRSASVETPGERLPGTRPRLDPVLSYLRDIISPYGVLRKEIRTVQVFAEPITSVATCEILIRAQRDLLDLLGCLVHERHIVLILGNIEGR